RASRSFFPSCKTMVRALSPSSLVAPSSFYTLLLLVVATLLGQHPEGPLRVATAQNTPAPVPVRVGLILDWATKVSLAVSLRRRTGIQMAVEDYYAAHPGSATRVELHFSDSKGDVVGDASAALDLIKNAQVQAIIGPKTSAEAEFVAQLGSRAHVPVLSYSATSPSISPTQTPYFVRTAANDSFQATPVASVLASFGWREVAVLHEDSPYGAGILPALADALQSVHSAAIMVVDRVPVPSGADEDALDALLYRLKAMPTRVFIVHASHSLAAQLFRRASKAGMMSDGYAWVATDGVGNFVDRARYRRENPASNDDVLNDATVTGLWSYDTAWAIAVAAEAASVPGPAFRTPQNSTARTDLDQLGVSTTGEALLRAILNTTFDGMAGRFKLVDGQLQVAAYEVVNIIGNGAVTVGFWTPESGISRDLKDGSGNAARQLKPIFWPGEMLSPPRGWTASQNGRVLRVAVPVKHGFTQFVGVVISDNSTKPKITGYCIDVFNEVMKNLSYPVSYQYMPFPDSPDSYEMLVDQVSERKADIVVGDVTITASRMEEVDFTMPFTESGWAMVVATEPDTSGSMWIFLQPLTTSLWLASLAFFCFTGFVVWVIEHRVNPEFRGTPSQQFGLIFYFAFSTLVFSHKEKLESNLSRFVVIIWVFVVLILTSSYTASLTSMLTVQQLRPTVTDVKELQRRGQYIGYQEGTFIKPRLKKMGFDERKMRKYSSEEQYAEALSKGSAKGGVDAVFDEIPYLKLFLSQHCDGYMQVGPVYKTDGFGFVFPRGSPMTGDVSRGILNLAEGDTMAQIEKAWFGEPGTCQNALGGIGGGGGSSNLSFWSFGGLFLITGVVSSLMLLLYLAIFAYREREELREAEAKAEAEAGSGSVSVRRLRAWLQHFDRKDLKSPTFKVWNDESVRNGSEFAGRTPRWNGSGGDASMTPRAGGEEHAMRGTTPLSLYISSEMNAGSSPEGTPMSEISESFEQRIEGAAAAMEVTRPTASQLQQ
uniref:Ionotropic glutamate receptor C-terminal domain-containing protein n=1 Tax=Aegilops tauschii subsp. strangulata TaxID=200361 RepID=A0A453PUN1_AEGTS